MFLIRTPASVRAAAVAGRAGEDAAVSMAPQGPLHPVLWKRDVQW